MLNGIRDKFWRFFEKPINFMVKHNVNPNNITVFGLFISIFSAITFALPEIFLYNHSEITPTVWWWWACVPPWLFFFGGYVDALDGSVARKTGKVSKFGGFLDSTLDRISDAVVLLGVILSGMIWPYNDSMNITLGFLALSMSLLISYTRSRAEIDGVVMKGIGFMERAERLFILLGGYILVWVTYAIEYQYMEISFEERTMWVFPAFFLVYLGMLLQTLWARINWAHKWLSGQIPQDKMEELRSQ